jgi:hypothetical protein
MEKNKRKEEHECEIERELIYQTRIFNLKWCWNTNDGKFQTHMYPKHRYGMKAELSDWCDYKCIC